MRVTRPSAAEEKVAVERTIPVSGATAILKSIARLVGVTIGAALALFLVASVAFGHGYASRTPAAAGLRLASTQVSTVASPRYGGVDRDDGWRAHIPSHDCYNGCWYNGSMYYSRYNSWYRYHNGSWWRWSNNCWNPCGSLWNCYGGCWSEQGMYYYRDHVWYLLNTSGSWYVWYNNCWTPCPGYPFGCYNGCQYNDSTYYFRSHTWYRHRDGRWARWNDGGWRSCSGLGSSY